MSFIFTTIASILFKGLGPINGYKTIIGVGLGIITELARYFDVLPVAIDGSIIDFIYQSLTALGIGHKMGK